MNTLTEPTLVQTGCSHAVSFSTIGGEWTHRPLTCAFLSRATVISSMDKLRETERAELAEKLDHQIHNTADKAHYIKKRGGEEP